MKATIHKPSKSYDDLLKDLKNGKSVKAVDLTAAMGITTITFD